METGLLYTVVLMLLLREVGGRLLPFGTKHGDQLARDGDDVVTCFPVASNFPLFTTINHKKLCISSNGYIIIDKVISYHNGDFAKHNCSVLAPYFKDMKSNGTDVFYRTTSSKHILELIDKDIALFLGIQNDTTALFNAKSAIIITFNNTIAYSNSSMQFQFQTTIATDYNSTFTVIEYEHLDLPATGIGFRDIDCNTTKRFTNSSNSRNLVKDSNIGIPGKHVYFLSDCKNKVMYPFGEANSDYKYSSSSSSWTGAIVELKLKGAWTFFTKPLKEYIYISKKGYISVRHSVSGMRYKSPSSRFTYIAPYFLDSFYSQTWTVYYRETNKKSLLTQVTKDILAVYPSMNYTPTHIFVSTFLYDSGTQFQLALATNGTDIFAVINYKELNEKATYISVRRCSGVQSLIPTKNAKELALKGNKKTGVPGRHVFYLTDKNCTQILGVRAVRSFWRGKHTIFASRDYIVDNVLKKYEYGNSFIYLKEAVTGEEKPASVVLFKPKLNVPFRTTFGFFSTVPYIYSSDLFIFDDTKKTNTFQYGNVKFPTINSFTVCRKVYFKQKMKSRPSVKTLPVISDKNFHTYVNIWLKSVSDTAFVVCAKEMIPFSGQHDLTVNYIAASAGDSNIQEVSQITFPAINQERPKYCLINKFNKIFTKTPDIFVTVEVENYEPSFVWVKSITKRQAVICLKSNIRNNAHKVNVLVTGEVRPCASHECPDNLECRVTPDSNSYCGCIKSCVAKEGRGEFCSNDFITYKSICHMNQAHCLKHGNSSKSHITVKHFGACQYRSIQVGNTKLEPLLEIPGVFCKYIPINRANFLQPLSSSPLKVLLTVSWNGTESRVPHDASTNWSQNITLDGFRACVLVSGRHTHSDFLSPPTVHWTVFNFRDGFFNKSQNVQYGIFTFDTWYSGSQCKKVISISNDDLVNYRVFTTIHHHQKNYHDAMTVWTENAPSTKSLNETDIRICARELQNFDGKHEGVVVHWLAFPKTIKSQLGLFIPVDVEFPAKSFFIGRENPVECKNVAYNYKYPNIPNPTFLIGLMNQQSKSKSSSSVFSQHDFAVWVERMEDTQVKVCIMSLNIVSNQRPKILVSLLVTSSFCEDGGHFFNGYCYEKLPGGCMSKPSAHARCVANGGNLPVIKNRIESIYIQEQIEDSSIWLDIDKSRVGWRTSNHSLLTYQKWHADQPTNASGDECAAIENRGIETGWKEENCYSCKNVICVKDANIERLCNNYCINGGTCHLLRSRTIKPICKCPTGFFGVKCQIDISKVNWLSWIKASLPSHDQTVN